MTDLRHMAKGHGYGHLWWSAITNALPAFIRRNGLSRSQGIELNRSCRKLLMSDMRSLTANVEFNVRIHLCQGVESDNVPLSQFAESLFENLSL